MQIEIILVLYLCFDERDKILLLMEVQNELALAILCLALQIGYAIQHFLGLLS